MSLRELEQALLEADDVEQALSLCRRIDAELGQRSIVEQQQNVVIDLVLGKQRHVLGHAFASQQFWMRKKSLGFLFCIFVVLRNNEKIKNQIKYQRHRPSELTLKRE